MATHTENKQVKIVLISEIVLLNSEFNKTNFMNSIIFLTQYMETELFTML